MSSIKLKKEIVRFITVNCVLHTCIPYSEKAFLQEVLIEISQMSKLKKERHWKDIIMLYLYT